MHPCANQPGHFFATTKTHKFESIEDVSTGLKIIFQNLSDIMSRRNEILWVFYENLLDINFYKNFIKS